MDTDQIFNHWLGEKLMAWQDAAGRSCEAHWCSPVGSPPPKRWVLADDRWTADRALAALTQGTALIWQGDFQNARQLLQALGRRLDRTGEKARGKQPAVRAAGGLPQPEAQTFHQHRMRQAQRARTLGLLLVPVGAGHRVALRRAPDVRDACLAAMSESDSDYVIPLRELNGVVGAFEWRKAGVWVPALNARIHAHYGVFSPVRGEYLELVAQAPLPPGVTTRPVFDLGTGTGVLAAILAHRGCRDLVATDVSTSALACAHENLSRLGLADQVRLLQTAEYPAGRAALVVCNPPWLPGKPSSALDAAIYDPDSAMLRGFLAGLSEYLLPDGEGWLILSDLAERLGLRQEGQILEWIDQAGLKVLDRSDAQPLHRKAFDPSDPFFSARSAEVTSLWRLGCKRAG